MEKFSDLLVWVAVLGQFCVVFPSVCTAVSRPVKFSSLWAPGLEKKLLVWWSPRGIGGNFLKQRPGPCSCILKAHPPPKIHPKSQSGQRPLGNFQPCWGGGSRQTIHITIGKTSHIGATKTHKKKQHCWPLLQQLKKKNFRHFGFLWVSLGFWRLQNRGTLGWERSDAPQKTALNHQGSSKLKRSLELGNSLSQGQGTFMTLSVPYNRIAQKICLLVGLLNSEPLRNPWCRQGCHLQALPMCLSPQGPRHLHHRA